MVSLGLVCKIRLKYSKELLDYKVKNTKPYIINLLIRVTMSHGVKIIFPMNEVLKTFKLGSFLISEGILFHRTDPL